VAVWSSVNTAEIGTEGRLWGGVVLIEQAQKRSEMGTGRQEHIPRLFRLA
jgi:hypothetical protein